MSEFGAMVKKVREDPDAAGQARKRLLELDDAYEQYRVYVIVWVLITGSIGLFLYVLLAVPFANDFLYSPLNQDTAEDILKEYIPEDLEFDDLSTQLGIPVFELENQYPLYLSPITNQDDDVEASELTVLEATVAGISDPFVYQPTEYHDLILVSAYNYASNPLYQSLTLINHYYDSNVKFTATSFFIDYTKNITEAELPTSIADWGNEINSLIYYMENNAQKYLTNVLF